MYEANDVPQVRIDPNLVIIGIVAVAVLAAMLLLLYFPTIEDFLELDQKYKRTKLQRDYYINQWCVEMINHGYSQDEIKRLMVDHEENLRKEQGRTKQASNRSSFIARLGDKLMGRA